MDDARTIMIVAEDEVLIRMNTVDLLGEAGFEVIEAVDGDEALEMLKAIDGKVHVLFTDIQMPGSIDGLALAHYVKQHWPDVAVIVTSGAATPKPGDLPEGGVFVPKPYHMQHIISHAQALTGR